MLKTKIVRIVPPNAVNMGYVRNEVLRPSRNVSLIDYSSDYPENYRTIGRTKSVRSIFVIGGSPTFLSPLIESDRAVVFSNRSVQHPDVKEPQPLYYYHELGCGPRQGGTRTYALISESAEFNIATARLELRKALTILDETGQVATDIAWDLQVVSLYTEGGENIGFNVNVWVDHPCTANRTYFIRYKAYNITTGEALPNHLEVLNARPGSLGITTIRGDGCPGWYFYGDVPIPPNPVSSAPGLALFPAPDGNTGQLRVAGDLEAGGCLFLEGPGGVPSHQLRCDPNISLRDLAAEINRYPYMIAVPLSPHNRLVLAPNTTHTPAQDGTVVKLAHTGNYQFVVHYKHRDERRIGPKLPVENPPYYSWNPRIANGEFVDLDRWTSGASTYYAELVYTLPDLCVNQEYSPNYSAGVREVIDEAVSLISARTVQTKRYPIYDVDSVDVTRDGRILTAPRDADLANGKLYFNTDLSEAGEVMVSYAYEAESYQFSNIDLNPVPLHNPAILDKYVGVYLVPSMIRTTWGTLVGDTWTAQGERRVYPASFEVTEVGDTGDQFERWDLYGLCPGGNTDDECNLYVSFADHPLLPITYQIFVYSDSAMTQLVASNETAEDGLTDVILTEQNNSGLTGRVVRTGIGPIVPGTLRLEVTDTRQCVRYVVGDSVQEVLDLLDAVPPYTDPGTGHESFYVKLLGIYHVSEASNVDEVDILDTRTRGGGLKDDVDPVNCEEARMWWDIGYWGGQAYQSAGAIITELPAGIVGTGIPSGVLPCNPLPSGWMEATNLLTTEQLDDKIKRHLALGVFPVLDVLPTGVQS